MTDAGKLVTALFVLFVIGAAFLLYQQKLSKDVMPYEELTKVNVTLINYTLNSSDCLSDGSRGYGHGDGICDTSYTWCEGCNCTREINSWCGNIQYAGGGST
jgi:hypothetical protein